MLNIFKYQLLCGFLLLLPLGTKAQTVLQVITKKIEKTFPYKVGYAVNIEGEKAEVLIETWERMEVKVVLELVAKHPDKSVATADLEHHKYLTERVAKNIYLRNYVSIEEGKSKPESSLKAIYTVKVPEDCPVYLKNHFGFADIRNLKNGLKINSEFSRIGLDNVAGDISLQTRFGDIEGQKLDGQVRIMSRRSNVTLRELKGEYDITAQYGTVRIYADQSLVDMKIDADKSDVFLYHPNPDEYAFALTAQHGKINTPKNVNFKLLDLEDLKHQAIYKPRSEFYPSITVSVTFGDITVSKN